MKKEFYKRHIFGKDWSKIKLENYIKKYYSITFKDELDKKLKMFNYYDIIDFAEQYNTYCNKVEQNTHQKTSVQKPKLQKGKIKIIITKLKETINYFKPPKNEFQAGRVFQATKTLNDLINLKEKT